MDLRPRTVLISFGSFAKAHLMLDEYKKSIVATVRKFPDVTFILKYEVNLSRCSITRCKILQIPEHRISDGVENLVETTWMPQNDILREILSFYESHTFLIVVF